MLLRGTTGYCLNKDDLVLEAVTDIKNVETAELPRILITHLPYRWLPRNHVETGGKIIHMIRNPKDVCASMYHFLKTVEDFGYNTEKMTFQQYLDNLVFAEGMEIISTSLQVNVPKEGEGKLTV